MPDGLVVDEGTVLPSVLLHQLSDRDVLLADELRLVSYYLRRIYQQDLKLKFRAKPFLG